MNRSLRVLVADDERDIREYLQEMLQRQGHQVVGAQTGRQLLKLARAGEPDLIITDIRMPDMDGIDAVAEVNRLRETPAILISSYHDAPLIERATQQLIFAYLIKPFEQSDVEAAVAVALARFEQYRLARREADSLKQALEERKLIERAKGAVMRRLSVDEQEAFRRLKRLSSEQNRKLIDIARIVLQAEEIFQLMDRVQA
jgi:response regulator NasT